jgi:hypothetical protein
LLHILKRARDEEPFS